MSARIRFGSLDPTPRDFVVFMAGAAFVSWEAGAFPWPYALIMWGAASLLAIGVNATLDRLFAWLGLTTGESQP